MKTIWFKIIFAAVAAILLFLIAAIFVDPPVSQKLQEQQVANPFTKK